MVRPLFAALRSNPVLLWACLIIGVNQLGFGLILPVLALFADSFGITKTAVGAVVSIYGLGRLLFGLPMGQLADRIGRRRIVVVGGVLSAIGSVLCGLTESFEALLVYRFIGGTGAAMVITGTQTILADISTPANRGRMMSAYQGTFLFAVGIGPGFGGLIADYFGYRAPFFAYAALGLAAGLVAFFGLPETKEIASKTARAAGGRTGSKAALRQLLTSAGFMLICAISFVQAVARTGAVFAVVPLLAQMRLGLSPGEIGLPFTVASLLNLATVPVSGILVDRFGRRPVILPSQLLAGASFLIFAVAGSYPAFMAAAIVWGVAGGIGGAAPAAYAADLAPPGANGITMGTYRTLADVGYVVGPILLGLIADLTGPVSALYFTLALFLVVVVLFYFLAPETHPKRAGSGVGV
ncbi:MAG: MFS transporter [Chloroflexi bacterium]|nr:MFS transporter [Chloroflexota bacterium]